VIGTTSSRLVAAEAAELRFEAQTRAQAPILLCPLFAALGVLPWLSDQLDPLRICVSALVLSLSVAIGLRCRPRKSRITLRPESRLLEADGVKHTLPPASRFSLELCHDDTEAPQGCYVVFLELGAGQRFALLRAAEPDALLRDLRQVLEHFPERVDCSWGLPAQAEPWVFDPPSADTHEVEPGTTLVDQRLAPLDLVRVVVAATIFVLFDLTFLVTSQQARLTRVHPLGVALPIVMGCSLVVLALSLVYRRVYLVAASRIQSETGALGLRWGQRSVRLERVRGVYLIGAEQAARQHLLLDTSDGPLAVSLERRGADAVAREVRRAIEQRNRGRLPSLESITSAPHTLPGA